MPLQQLLWQHSAQTYAAATVWHCGATAKCCRCAMPLRKAPQPRDGATAKQRALYCDGCVEAMALLELRCNRISFRLLRRLPPLLTLSERSRAMRPLLCRRPPLYTHSVSVSMGVTCGSKHQCILETGRDGQQQASVFATA